MKKIYSVPEMIEAEPIEESMIAQSIRVTSNKDIGYGGVDTNGSKDPEVKGEAGWFDYE